MTRFLVLLVVCTGVAVVPSNYVGLSVAAAVATVTHTVAGEGLAGLARSLVQLRWVVMFTLIPQLVFVTFEVATANTVRVVAAISIAELMSRAVPASELMLVVEHLLRPFSRAIDAERVALMVALAVTTIPVMARLARTIREAHIARGVRPRIHRLVVPLIVAALKHADELGDALVVRGVGGTPQSITVRRASGSSSTSSRAR